MSRGMEKSGYQNSRLPSPSANSIIQTNSLTTSIKNHTRILKKKSHMTELNDLIKKHQQEIIKTSHEIFLRKSYYDYANKCAIVIQKYFRGFLVRLHCIEVIKNQEILVIRKRKLVNCVEKLRSSTENAFYCVGRNHEWASWKITGFCRRMHFLLKIRRLQCVYKHFLVLRQAEASILIRKLLRVNINRNLIKQKVFERHRAGRLIAIKRNLATLTIKNYFQRNNITIKNLKKRYRRQRRILKASKSISSGIENNSTRDKMSTSEDYSSTSSNNNLNNHGNLNQISECPSFTSTEFLEQEKAKRKIIEKSMISYNIQKLKLPASFLPFLGESSLASELKLPEPLNISQDSNQTTRKNRFSSSSKERPSPKLPAIIKPLNERIKHKKLVFSKDNLPHFINDTICSNLYKKNSDEALKEETPKPKGSHNFRWGSTLLNQTFCGMLKSINRRPHSFLSHNLEVSLEKMTERDIKSLTRPRKIK